MTVITTRFGEGGANLVPGGSGGTPVLADTLRDIADDLGAGSGAVAPSWTTGIAVSSNTVTLADAGFVLAVEATTATAAGPKQQIQSGSPAAGEVDVAYDGNGVATLTFNAVDAVTACAVSLLARTSGHTIKTTKG